MGDVTRAANRAIGRNEDDTSIDPYKFAYDTTRAATDAAVNATGNQNAADQFNRSDLNTQNYWDRTHPDVQQINPDANAEEAKKRQVEYANRFRSDIPGMENQMNGFLKKLSQQGLGEDISKSRGQASSRGLLYGGAQAGKEGRLRAGSQARLGEASSTLHQGLLSSADTLDAQAIETGLGIQANQQALQNQAYQQALAKMNSANSDMGAALSTAATIALL